MADRELLELVLNKVTNMEAEQQSVKKDISLIKETMATKEEVTEIKLEQQKTNERLTSIESKQQIIYEQTGKLTEYHTETMSQFEQLPPKKLCMI
jgi:regulator of replication initiation timing